MKTTLLTLALSLSIQLIFAQEDSLLRQFKFRNINYRAVNLDFGGGSNFRSQELPPGENKVNASSGSIGGSYYNIKSTGKILFTISGSIGTSLNFDRAEDNSNDSKSRSFSTSPQLSLLNKWFSKKIFTELGVDVSTNFYTWKYRVSNTGSETRRYENFQLLAITLGIGKGRLENITNMQNALWLNRALEKEGNLSQPLTAEELNALGHAINEANNTRVLDSRKRIQFVLESVDNFFQRRGLVRKTDIRYFSNMNDNLFFAFSDYRQSGMEKFVRLRPGITNYRDNNSEKINDLKTQTESRNLSVALSAGLNKYVPVNLQHQNNFGITMLLNYVSNMYNLRFFTSGVQDSEFNSEPTLKQAGLTAFYQHAIYPNTRTIVSANLSSQAGYQDAGEKTGFLAADLWGNLSYFISYRTRFNCNLGMSYKKNIYDISRYFILIPETVQFNVSAGIQVSI